MMTPYVPPSQGNDNPTMIFGRYEPATDDDTPTMVMAASRPLRPTDEYSVVLAARPDRGPGGSAEQVALHPVADSAREVGPTRHLIVAEALPATIVAKGKPASRWARFYNRRGRLCNELPSS